MKSSRSRKTKMVAEICGLLSMQVCAISRTKKQKIHEDNERKKLRNMSEPSVQALPSAVKISERFVQITEMIDMYHQNIEKEVTHCKEQ